MDSCTILGYKGFRCRETGELIIPFHKAQVCERFNSTRQAIKYIRVFDRKLSKILDHWPAGKPIPEVLHTKLKQLRESYEHIRS